MTAKRPRGRLGEALIRGGVGPLYRGDQEIVRRIFVTVRDRAWREIAPSEWRACANPDGHSARLTARHIGAGIDFEWQGTVSVGEDLSSLQFTVEGQTRIDMQVCRLGLVVLYPLEFMIGSSVRVGTGPDVGSFTIAPEIYAQPIVNGVPAGMTQPFSELAMERPGLGTLHLKFEGDLFELEDQRNWGDASFKTYCTPLRLGFPRFLQRASKIHQAVEATFVPAASATGRSSSRARPHVASNVRDGSRPAEPPSASNATLRRPALGVTLSLRQDEAPPDAGWMRAWDHVQLHVDQCTPSRLRELLASLPNSLRLELMVTGKDCFNISDPLAEILSSHENRIARIVMTHESSPLPSREVVTDFRNTLAAQRLAGVALFLLPRGWFAELNRGPPLDFAVDGYAFPLSPTVHASDPKTVLDNAEAAGDMVWTLRRLAKGAEVAVIPLGAFFPASEGTSLDPAIRMPWLAKTLSLLSVAGASSITLAPDTLW